MPKLCRTRAGLAELRESYRTLEPCGHPKNFLIGDEHGHFTCTVCKLAEHRKHVQRFLQQMYATMIDPVEDATGTIADTCKLPLEAATRDRQQLSELADLRRDRDSLRIRCEIALAQLDAPPFPPSPARILTARCELRAALAAHKEPAPADKQKEDRE